MTLCAGVTHLGIPVSQAASHPPTLLIPLLPTTLTTTTVLLALLLALLALPPLLLPVLPLALPLLLVLLLTAPPPLPLLLPVLLRLHTIDLVPAHQQTLTLLVAVVRLHMRVGLLRQVCARPPLGLDTPLGLPQRRHRSCQRHRRRLGGCQPPAVALVHQLPRLPPARQANCATPQTCRRMSAHCTCYASVPRRRPPV